MCVCVRLRAIVASLCVSCKGAADPRWLYMQLLAMVKAIDNK